MAVRNSSPLFRYLGAKGTYIGWNPTDRDRLIVQECSRWAMLTSWDIATRTLPTDVWFVTPEQRQQEPKPQRLEGLDVSVNAVKRVRERLTRLVNNYPHPLLTSTHRGQFAAIYQSTGSGNTFVGIDTPASRISPNAQSYSMKSGHMLSAARVGRCLELGGFRVISEKEAASNIAIDGDPLPPNMVSYYQESPNAKPIEKRPDLILPTPVYLNGDTHIDHYDGYIAVEVELARHRQPSVYETKLTAYAHNPACKGVIYISRENSVAERVTAAAERVYGSSDAAPVVVQQLRDGTLNAVNYRASSTKIRNLYQQCAPYISPTVTTQ